VEKKWKGEGVRSSTRDVAKGAMGARLPAAAQRRPAAARVGDAHAHGGLGGGGLVQ
jgi:hypothetical protein